MIHSVSFFLASFIRKCSTREDSRGKGERGWCERKIFFLDDLAACTTYKGSRAMIDRQKFKLVLGK